LGTGAKVAIGCAIALVIGGVLAVVLLGGAVWWGKTKLEQARGEMDKFAGGQTRIEELQKKANANTFHQPPDHVIDESRLLTFLELRKRVYEVYKKHEAEIEARRNKKEGDFGDVAAFVRLVNEIRTALAQAQADLGMSDAEYRFMEFEIYRTQWATEAVKQAGGTRSPPPAGETGAEAEKYSRDVAEATKVVDVPAANVALFKKHEADIKKYAMNGMEWIGL
jgi:hypothetical protein